MLTHTKDIAAISLVGDSLVKGSMSHLMSKIHPKTKIELIIPSDAESAKEKPRGVFFLYNREVTYSWWGIIKIIDNKCTK